MNVCCTGTALLVVKAPNEELSEEDVISFSKEKLASYKAVKEVVFVDELPRNAVGKILKNRLKELVVN
ncbi:hypothetical protein [Sporosarcina sp. NCCP-2331]|uniref:AMP-binding enzyme n=1 Tax=unclassified Sporosarcina TaxID=2647733 RepID=UPI00208755F9|nr:hypothetical protein NCCP2331_35850 [Sporosarcina sp. NCCP-2331]GLB57794.1 hypothetical protein NCCP2378_35860 [Sporosarcina sp. NCCP-2378]